MTPFYRFGDVIYEGLYWRYAVDHARDYLGAVNTDEARRQGYPQRVRILKRGEYWRVVGA